MKTLLYILILFVAGSCAAPKQSGSLAVFNPRAVDSRLQLRAGLAANMQASESQNPAGVAREK